MAALRGYNQVFLGHVHKPQTLFENAYYIGSPFQQNFGESGEQKRVAIYDTESDVVEWVEVDFLPKYREVSFEIWEAEVNEQSEDRYKVILANQDETEEFYAHPLSGRAIPTYAYQLQEEHQDSSENVAVDTESILKTYVDRHPPSATGLLIDEDELYSIGLSIVNS